MDQAFQDALLASLRWHRGMLIGEVVPLTLSYLRHNPQAPEREAYSHVLVDEYQDLNKAEQVLIDLLSGDQNLAVIRDDDQSIYGFKHANPDEGLANAIRYNISQPEVPLETPYARVMSLHKSKGLTAELVVIAGVVDGLIPRIDRELPEAEQQAQLEEQRRLFFRRNDQDDPHPGIFQLFAVAGSCRPQPAGAPWPTRRCEFRDVCQFVPW